MEVKRNSDWILKQFEDPDFVLLYKHEGFIEDFLMRIHAEMTRKNIKKREMAAHMKCSLTYLTALFQRTKPMHTRNMVDMADAVGLNISITFTEE